MEGKLIMTIDNRPVLYNQSFIHYCYYYYHYYYYHYYYYYYFCVFLCRSLS